MAIATAGTLAVYTDDFLDYNGLLFSSGVGSPTATAFTTENAGTGGRWQFTGTGFGGYEGGLPTTGNITGIVFSVSGVTNLTLTGISLPIVTFYAYIANNDPVGLLQFVYSGADTITGSALNDRLFGYGGADIIHGGEGADVISGGGGAANTLAGEGGDDIVESSAAGDAVTGGDGQDLLVLYRAASASVQAITVAALAAGTTLADGTSVASFERFDIYTGAANDTVIFSTLVGVNGFNGGDGTDKMVLQFGDQTSGFTMGFPLPERGTVTGDGWSINFDKIEMFEVTGGAGDDAIGGGALADILNGGGGTDSIDGRAGNDTLNGGEGADAISGGDGDDIVNGDGGNDNLHGSVGQNTLNGGEGDDYINSQGTDTVDGGDGDDMLAIDLSSATGNLTIDTAAMRTALGATLENGTTVRNVESFYIQTGSGNDTFIVAGLLPQIQSYSIAFWGNGGVDRFVGDFSSLNVAVDFNNGLIQINGVFAQAGVEIFELTGGSGNDHFVTNSGDDILSGSAGNDYFAAYDGANTLNGGADDDYFLLSGGVDAVDGGDGIDFAYLSYEYLSADLTISLAGSTTNAGATLGNGATIRNVENYELRSGSGNDTLLLDFASFSGQNRFVGGDGTDRLIADFSAATTQVQLDTFYLTTAAGQLDHLGRLEIVQVTSGSADDYLAGNFNTVFILNGGGGADIVYGASANDQLWGGDGADVLAGSDGNDLLEGGAGADYLEGSNGIDTASYAGAAAGVSVNLATGAVSGGDAAGDTFSSIENLTGSAHADILIGSAEGNQLRGGGGSDVLRGGDGDDLIDGGDGVDTADYSTAGSGVTASLATAAQQNTGGAGADTLSAVENLNGSTHADTLTGNASANTLNGNDGADTLSGGGGSDTLAGGAGDDLIDGGDGGDTADYSSAGSAVTVSLATTASQNTGGAGADTLSDVENLNGGTFADTLTGDIGANTLNGSDGADTLSGNGGSDTINGGAGDDVLFGHSNGASGAITSTVLASGYAIPVAAAAAPGDPGYIYVLEKDTGIIWRTDADTGARTQFLDIPQGDFSRDGEGGAIGLAFHPDYAANGRFFVFVTDPDGDLQVREFARAGGSPPVANNTSTLVIEIAHPVQSNHNGGWIEFSPTDGYLYIATGDGGGGGDPNNNAQNINSLLGKILRIDVNSDGFPGDATRNYAIPGSNPFAGVAGADEIWHFGLRNPFRNAFDSRNGDLYIGDVGQSAREEIDYAASGAGDLNFGWRIMEGDEPYPPGSPDPNNPNLVAPIFDYPRDIGTTVTGGEVYVGSNQSFTGTYVFADYGSDRVFTLRVENGVAFDILDRTGQIGGPLPVNVVDFVRDSDGNLYAVGIGGTIWRLDPAVGAEDVGDVLYGGAGNDYLDGNFGADQMYGGADNDTYVVEAGGDAVIELLNEGTDTVLSSITYSLGANVENLTLTGSAALNGAGNALNNVLVGNGAANTLQGLAGNDTLNGGGGADKMYGGEGDDIYYVDHVSDVTFEANVAWGTDLTYSSITFTLGQNIDNLTLTGAGAIRGNGNGLANVITGNGAVNVLYGYAGNDTLDGGLGADKMYGGEGNDTYYVNESADFAFEGDVNWGADTVYASTTYTLGLNMDHLILTTAAGAAIGKGNALNNTIAGNASVNVLYGFDGADTLDGGAGADKMYGGTGNDTYIVDTAADVAFEADAGWGTDHVYASVTYTLSANMEDLTLTGSLGIRGNGNDSINHLTGNTGNNVLYGYAGNDTLDGGVGADTMYGGEGDDSYYVDSSSDVVFESSAAWGHDTVFASATFVLGANIDDLILTGLSAINGAGNSAANVIAGNGQANVLNGAGGNDELTGWGGNDTLTGGAGDDAFVFQVGSQGDVITDFVAGGAEDSIDLSAYDGSGVTWTVDQVGADTVFTFTNGDLITLTNVTAGNLVYDGLFGYS